MASRFRVISTVFAALAVLVIGTASSAPAQTFPGDPPASDRPGQWRGSGGALGVRLYFNTEPRLLPVDDMLTIHVPDVQTAWDSTGDANARASSIFPGQTVVGLPDLLATFGVPSINEILPPYPATAFASPTAPDVTSADGTSRAVIDPGGEFIESRGAFAVPGATDALAPFVELGPGSAISRQSFEAGALVSRSRVELGSVSLLGGLVSLDGIDVRAEAAASEGGEPTTKSSVAVGKASILGVPVAIREEGIEVAGLVIPPGGFPEAFRPSGVAGRLNSVVSALGLRLQLVGGDDAVDESTARSQATGVLFEARVPIDGPALPALPLDRLPVNPNDLLPLPLPLPDLDPNVLYRTYVVSAVIGEARAETFATEGFGGLDATAPLEPGGATSSGPVSDLGSVGGGFGGSAAGFADTPAPPSSTPGGGSASTPTPIGRSEPSLRLLADGLGIVLAACSVLGLLGLAGSRIATSVLRTPDALARARPRSRS